MGGTRAAREHVVPQLQLLVDARASGVEPACVAAARRLPESRADTHTRALVALWAQMQGRAREVLARRARQGEEA